MAKHQQMWMPDTCADIAAGDVCVLITEWDDEDPTKPHTFTRREKACSLHALTNPEDGYNRVLEENTRKNVVFSIAQEKVDGLLPEEYEFSYDEDGMLFVKISKKGITTGQRQSIIDTVVAAVGAGKVTFL